MELHMSIHSSVGSLPLQACACHCRCVISYSLRCMSGSCSNAHQDQEVCEVNILPVQKPFVSLAG